MGFRASLVITGIIAILISYFVGYWIAWIGITLLFVAAIFHFVDKE